MSIAKVFDSFNPYLPLFYVVSINITSATKNIARAKPRYTTQLQGISQSTIGDIQNGLKNVNISTGQQSLLRLPQWLQLKTFHHPQQMSTKLFMCVFCCPIDANFKDENLMDDQQFTSKTIKITSLEIYTYTVIDGFQKKRLRSEQSKQ